jgi:site-specific recombinase XerD
MLSSRLREVPMAAILGDGTSELERLTRSFRRHLRAENLSNRTIETYMEAVEQFLAHLFAEKVPTPDGITREHTDGFIAWLVDHRSAATANNRYRGLHRFIGWLVEEEYLPADPMTKTKAPKVPEQPMPVLPKASLKALLSTCRTRSFTDIRDRAILLLLCDIGIRRTELLQLRPSDVFLDEELIEVLGKGGRKRQDLLGRKVIKALDRYEVARSKHPYAHSEHLWLGRKGPLGPTGLRLMLNRRARQAGISGIHPHLFRHSFAHHYRADGGSEGHLMRLDGWKSRAMMDRYGASGADEQGRARGRPPRCGRVSPRPSPWRVDVEWWALR